MSRARDFADLAGSADAGGLTGRNLVINGAMQVAQRGTSSAVTTSSGYFTVDRFRTTVTSDSAGRHTQSQATITDLPGFSNAIKLDCTTADTSIAAGEILVLATRFEGQDLQQLQKGTSSAKSVTVSFYAKGTAKTYMCELSDQDNTRHNTQQFTVSTSWTRHSLTFVGDTTGTLDDDTALSLILSFWLHAGSTYSGGTYTANTWASTTTANRAAGIDSFFSSTDNELFITGIQLEVGEKATPFEHRSYADELRKCQRYFYFLNLGGTYQVGGGLPGMLYSTDLAFATIPFMCEMRAAPSITPSNANTWQFINASDSPHQCQTVAGYASSKYSASITLDPSSSSSTPNVSQTGGGILWPGNANSNDATVSLAAEL